MLRPRQTTPDVFQLALFCFSTRSTTALVIGGARSCRGTQNDIVSRGTIGRTDELLARTSSWGTQARVLLFTSTAVV